MFSILLNIFLLVLGGTLITYGAEWLTDGSAEIARKYHISEMVIGLTLVAFGTSMPEFVVSLFAAFEDKASLSIGNIVGSNLFNTFMVIGCAALVTPISIKKTTINKDVPFVLFATFLLCLLALDSLWSTGKSTDDLGRIDGIILLCMMAWFLGYSFSIAKDKEQEDNVVEMRYPMWKALLLVFIGLGSLIGGGQIFVDSACELARMLGVSEAVIGLTIVAGGTSLPELVTSVVAARKGYSDIAIGNVIGSNIFNVFFILGTCAVITPLKVDGITPFDFLLLLASTILMWMFARTKFRIDRLEGGVFVIIYLAYLSWLIYQVL